MFASLRRYRIAAIAALAAGAFAFSAAEMADARSGGGKSTGSRGSRTYSAPAATNTAPTAAQPMQRTVTQPGQTNPSATAARPGQPAPAAAPSFGRTLMTGLAFGLIGAGLFGLLSGAGFGGLAGILGLIFQVGLVVLAFMLIRRLFAGRSQPALATANVAPPPPQQPNAYARAGMTGVGASAPVVNITSQDYDAFQRTLGVVQTAYGREDIGTLRMNTTPEMAAYFEDDLADNRAKGVLNRVGKVELLQGDLSEAWAEPDAEYATVAMRYAIADAMIERGTGKVVSGSLDQPEQVTEVWTFRREPRSAWKLSAIQQVQ